MEDGLNEAKPGEHSSEPVNNGVVSPIMANFPDGMIAVTKEEKCNNLTTTVNGNSNLSNEEISSESDALVIDEELPKQKKTKKRKSVKAQSETSKKTVNNNSEVVTHSNPYFNESLFELSQQIQEDVYAEVPGKAPSNPNNAKLTCKVHKHKKGKAKNAKVREYAQYLGLQPAVQFKCSKCGQAGFESLSYLNEHMISCSASPCILPKIEDKPSNSFKLTRKVFLCSACGTYYENWNLYMHMLEFHKRFICLYCLGMFSVLDDLCTHIQTKHHLEPGHKNTPEEFFNAYPEPCYIVCCECKKHFSEQDNFFFHDCGIVKNPEPPSVLSVESNLQNSDSKTLENSEENCDNSDTKKIKEPDIETNQDTSTLETETNEQPESISDITAENDLNSMETNDKFETTTELHDETPYEANENNYENGVAASPGNMSNASGDFQSPEEENVPSPEVVETRKVPKLSLKLPKLGSFPEIVRNTSENESDGSEKLPMEVDQIESETENLNGDVEENAEVEDNANNSEDVDVLTEDLSAEKDLYQIAGPDIVITELELEQPLDKFEITALLERCLKATVSTCIYCNHARKIAVNGKQLALHAIAEHRYSAVVNSITAEELIPESFVTRIKESLHEVEDVFFNLESNTNAEAVTFSHVFECFQCRFSTSVHKELYLHNRKLHTKNLVLCIMCKSNFYSYSELICHLCPGVYVLDFDVKFRCCMCVSDDLPSSFRLMVHLRKAHHICDVCLEMCYNQYKLSNHVWKHKLHHFCYRCGIAYRNKLDIQRHLFWKHGTESVMCKKCLQKKWPHVYHFCVPPVAFTCEECKLVFSRAVYLKVHKRLHSENKPYPCSIEGCEEKCISKKLLVKHELRHTEPPEEPKIEEIEPKEEIKEEAQNGTADEAATPTEPEEKPKPKVDVYDLPALNLSESDSDSEDETKPPKSEKVDTVPTDDQPTFNTQLNEIITHIDNELSKNIEANSEFHLDEATVAQQQDINIWDNFKNYQANKEKLDHKFVEPEKVDTVDDMEVKGAVVTAETALLDHDYCFNPEMSKPDISMTEVKPDLTQTQRVDHDYCTPQKQEAATENKDNVAQGASATRMRTNSSSSSSSSGSSCSCGSNCSCSSSSGSSSSSDSSGSDSSTEEGRRRQQDKRDKRRIKRRALRREKDSNVDVGTESTVTAEPTATTVQKVIPETPIVESDLETTESETDEEFYDKQPQLLARKILEEKRKKLLAEIGPLPNGGFVENSRPSTPSLPEESKPKKKSKSKKRKKKKERKERYAQSRLQFFAQPPTVAPITISLNRNSPAPPATVAPSPFFPMSPQTSSQVMHPSLQQQSEHDRQRASKRRRVPNKFYGYSSDEDEREKNITIAAPPPAKIRKIVPAQNLTVQHHPSPPPLLVPPITIKTGPQNTVSIQQPSQQPMVQPITIRPTARPGELRVHSHPRIPPIKMAPLLRAQQQLLETPTLPDSDSNDSSTDEAPPPPEPILPPAPPAPQRQAQLYCYCRCPYDEVSEMIGCDSNDCEIEWFHFECVGIMVPPKGQWFCPDCRKRKQRREMALS